ncbi:hypothetical protein [Tichowtungia aerotolerans]|uniref:Uncharacterized protein n=1 Tax=Tichowtungia aerotolerans TaxID=2697043 RepID=A0A6P1MDK1_9BACT|nr:hypothetical protein [Tichowtungia aerotolerans]QHI70644.1 hypothetical protein GT409_14740 [Tichowtungia aerotolerans]
MTFYTSNANTDRDAAFFRSCLEMKLWHDGAVVVPKGEEVTLYVLLDVLGTNRSRKDRIVQITEMLNASCEFTYYAVDVKTGKLLFQYRRNGGEARYKESTVLFLGLDTIDRSIEASMPLEMPVFTLWEEPKKVETTSPAKPAPKPAEKPDAKPDVKSAQKPAAKPTPKPAPKPAGKPPAAKTVESKPQASPTNGKKSDPYRLNKEQKGKELQELADQARMQVETGRTNEAKKTLTRINNIDPNAEEAKEIEQLLLDEGFIK